MHVATTGPAGKPYEGSPFPVLTSRGLRAKMDQCWDLTTLFSFLKTTCGQGEETAIWNVAMQQGNGRQVAAFQVTVI